MKIEGYKEISEEEWIKLLKKKVIYKNTIIFAILIVISFLFFVIKDSGEIENAVVFSLIFFVLYLVVTLINCVDFKKTYGECPEETEEEIKKRKEELRKALPIIIIQTIILISVGWIIFDSVKSIF